MTALTPLPKAPSILIVDDEPGSVAALSFMLEQSGYHLRHATTGEQALKLYEEEAPHLVILDIRLPGIDGLETCRRLRVQYGDACAPVVLISGVMDHLSEGPGFPPGVVDFLVKPFKTQDALVHVRAHLEARLYAVRQHAMAEALARANEAKNRCLGMCAHDLRSPLSSIRGLANFLLDPDLGPLSDDQKQIVATIRDASQGMFDLVSELLELSVFESGELRLNLAPASLPDIVAQCVRLAAIEAEHKGTTLRLLPSAAADAVVVDAARIHEVVNNLLSNAIKYSPPGATITAWLDVLVDDPDGQVVRCSVRDQGPGVLEAERPRLFQDFGRLSARPTNGEKSTGLGLSISRQIIEAHGGRISAINQPEGGCVFGFTLPPQPCHSPAQSSSSTTNPTSGGSSLFSSASSASAK